MTNVLQLSRTAVVVDAKNVAAEGLMVWSPSPPLQDAYLAISDGGYYAGPPRIASTSRSPSEPFKSLESVDLT